MALVVRVVELFVFLMAFWGCFYLMLEAAQRGMVFVTAEMAGFTGICLLLIGIVLIKKPDP